MMCSCRRYSSTAMEPPLQPTIRIAWNMERKKRRILEVKMRRYACVRNSRERCGVSPSKSVFHPMNIYPSFRIQTSFAVSCFD
ncbi:hypothetical protein TNCT_152461 [Trichonephila clavata]|uniref:Uncharacterized protein n=1 Tax=Trichonephila clavata TaxID=2740835 RepID=A0A8X6K705_TRICU|nr:hypothetical protein TNCT_152461 [Trichonephila clavata]